MFKNASAVIYFYEDSYPGKVEGTIYRRKKKGSRYVIDPAYKEVHFDQLDHIPNKLRKLYKRFKKK